MSQKFKKIAVMWIAAFVVCAARLNVYADDLPSCEAEIAQIERELDDLDAECFAEIDAAQAATDKATRELAAESAVRKALQVDNENMERALRAEREKRIRTEERAPKRAVWFAAGAATSAAAGLLVAFLVVSL